MQIRSIPDFAPPVIGVREWLLRGYCSSTKRNAAPSATSRTDQHH
jgi:hypothetical protein